LWPTHLHGGNIPDSGNTRKLADCIEEVAQETDKYKQWLERKLADEAVLLERLRDVEVAHHWQVIDTAPKDTALLLYSSFGYVVGHFNTALNQWVNGWDHRPLQYVTHWMPLPQAPHKRQKQAVESTTKYPQNSSTNDEQNVL
jgi:hypothetical protein